MPSNELNAILAELDKQADSMFLGQYEKESIQRLEDTDRSILMMFRKNLLDAKEADSPNIADFEAALLGYYELTKLPK